MSELVWHLPEGARWTYEYQHRRTVSGSNWFTKSNLFAERNAEMVISVKTPGQTADVVLTNILDQGYNDQTQLRRPLNNSVFPVVTFDSTGRILATAAPPTFGYIFVPELEGLQPGQRRVIEETTPLKTGFGKVQARGSVSTLWESTETLGGMLCAVLITETEFSGPPARFPWSPGSAFFRSRSVIHFDLERGRLVLGTNTSFTEQTIMVHRVKQKIEMSFRLIGEG